MIDNTHSTVLVKAQTFIYQYQSKQLFSLTFSLVYPLSYIRKKTKTTQLDKGYRSIIFHDKYHLIFL